MRNNVDDFMQWTSGNKPPQFFMFANPQTADNFTLEHKDFSVSTPSTYEKDWKKMLGWRGGFIYGGAFYSLAQYSSKETGGIILDYTIEFTSSTTSYGEREKKIEEGNVVYIRNLKTWLKASDILTIKHHGKEDYPCIVITTKKPKQGIQEKIYSCYKFNSNRTRAKSVTVSIIYTKSPNLPKKYQHLAKEYTYEDLLKRSQRVLDSLYIKDGWDE
jgi:hypothetical protein